MLVMPWALRTAAVVRMIEYITTCEKAIPTTTSLRAARSSLRVIPLRSSSVAPPAAFISSTSLDACQKNRYGEIVVPRMAWEGLTFAEVRERWPAEVTSWLADPAVAPPGGESFTEVSERVIAADRESVAQ